MKTIIAFYTKASALEQLSGFYDSCAQVEIDEYWDYEKALGAMREALKHLTTAECTNWEDKLELLSNRIKIVEKFVEARGFIKTNPKMMIDVCSNLLMNPDVDTAIWVGDVYAQMIEYCYESKNMKDALRFLNDMKARKIVVNPYLDLEMVENIYWENGINPTASWQWDDIDEDIKEEF